MAGASGFIFGSCSPKEWAKTPGRMKPQRRAVIDIGTNSVKLLVAEVRGTFIDPIVEESEQTRLGRGFYEQHLLQPGPIQQTALAVARLAQSAREAGAESIQLIATSAARDARNAMDLKAAVEAASGLIPRIITGEEEAELAFRGVTSDPAFQSHSLAILDVGGGSTEIITGSGEHHLYRQSYPIGSVRLMERFPTGDPPLPEELTRCRQWLIDQLPKREAFPVQNVSESGGPMQLVGTGGAATILARMTLGLTGFDRSRIDGLTLTRQQIREALDRIWNQSLADRRTIPGMPPNRADIILMGALIYDTIMELYGYDTLTISTRGLRFGALQ